MGLLAFWEGALCPAQKALPNKSKRTFFSIKRTVKMIYQLRHSENLRGAANSICDLSVTLSRCGVVVKKNPKIAKKYTLLYTVKCCNPFGPSRTSIVKY